MLFNPPRAKVLVTLLLAMLFLVLPAGSSAKSKAIVDLTLEGNKRVTSIELHKWTTHVEGGDKTTVAFAKEVQAVLLQRYRESGYPYVRVWTQIKKGGQDVTVSIDEGEIHRIVLVGVDALDGVFYRVDLHLPDRVFHTPTYNEALDVLRRKYKLPGIYGEVRNNPLRMTRNTFGESITERELIVTVVKKQRFGWGFNLAFNPRWGILPGVSTRSRSTFLRGDTLTTQARIAIPYREYLIQEEPEVQWVHGLVAADYLFPFWGQTRLAPGLEVKSELSRYSREDLDVRFVLTSRTESFFRLEFVPTP